MADIVDFRSTASRRSSSAPRRAQSAEIVIFPGIRYERWEEPPAEPVTPVTKDAAPKKSRKKRESLELIDA